jgi:hypothetical protein
MMKKSKFKQLLLKMEGTRGRSSRNDILISYNQSLPKRNYIDLKSTLSINVNKNKSIGSHRSATQDLGSTVNASSYYNNNQKSRNNKASRKTLVSSAMNHRTTLEATIHSECLGSNRSINNKTRLDLSSPRVKQSIRIQKAIITQRKKNEYDHNLIKTAKQKVIMEMEERREQVDKVSQEAYEEYKQRGFIRDFLKSKDYLLIREGLNEPFYKKRENLINFKADSMVIPNIRNHMMTENRPLDERIRTLLNINSIDIQTQIYLNVMKRKCQRDKDEKRLSIERITKKDVIDAKVEDVFRKVYGNIVKLENIDTYDYNDYLLFKYDRYDKVDFAREDVKGIVLKLSVDNI